MPDLGPNDLGAHVRGLLVTKAIPHRFCVPTRWATGYVVAVRIFPHPTPYVLISDSTTGEELLVGHHYLYPPPHSEGTGSRLPEPPLA